MPVYRPRVTCVLHVPVLGSDREDTVTLPIRPRRVSLEYNDHNHADTASVAAEWRDAGVDPRFLKNATCEIWLGSADENGVFTPNDANLRFIGVMTRPRRSAREGEGFQTELEFHDYTEFFLQQKPFPTAGLPSFSDSLLGAWQKICDHTGPLAENGQVLTSVSALRGRIQFTSGVDPDLTLASAVASRFARLRAVPAKEGSDAWAVWQQCVGMLGLISYIDRDSCIVTTSTEYYTPETAPKLVWGKNIMEAEEEANGAFSGKGVGITSFDPLTGTTIEAFYPPPGDARVRAKRVTAGRHKAQPQALQSDQYDFFEYHGVTDPDRLQRIAQRAWEERSRQELEGRLHTAEMFVDTVDGSYIDILSLRAGDTVRVEIDKADNETLASLGDDARRLDYLTARGYSADAAKLIVRNMKASSLFDLSFHAKRVAVQLEADGDAGKFDVEIEYQNRIKVAADGADV